MRPSLTPGDLVVAGLAVGGHDQFRDGTGLVGPLVIPGVTSCLDWALELGSR